MHADSRIYHVGGAHTPARRPEERMSFKTRERKRRKRIASSAAQLQSRRTGSSAAKWWLTPLTKTGCCARCGRVLRRGRDGVYRHAPGELLCIPCADTTKVFYRPSLRWQQRERERRRR